MNDRKMPAELLERLYRTHNDQALRRLQRVLSREYREAAEDALADAWVILARKPKYVRELRDPTAWLVACGRRLALRQTIRHARHAAAVNVDQLGGRFDVERQALARVELRELVDTLTTPEPYRPGAGATMTEGRRRALMGQLVGLTYTQAMEATGQSWAQINRGLSEGRGVLRARAAGR